MANIISLGSLYIDDQAVESGKPYTPGKKIGIGRSDSHPIQWVMVNGALIANRVLLTYVSWDDLDAHGFATGREIVLDGIRCFCRLLQVGDNDGVPNEWDAALAATNDDSDELWHYSNCAFWGSDTPAHKSKTTRVLRGGTECPREWDCEASWHRYQDIGFRPALELVRDFKPLVVGTRLAVWSKESLITGTLSECTGYDLIFSHVTRSCISDRDRNRFMAAESNNRVIVNQSGLLGVQMVGK